MLVKDLYYGYFITEENIGNNMIVYNVYDIIDEKYIYNNIKTIEECKKKIIERIERGYRIWFTHC